MAAEYLGQPKERQRGRSTYSNKTLPSPARAIFRPSGKSQAFETREIIFERSGEAVVIGRNSCFNSTPKERNLYFICSVVSRTHGFFWYDDKKSKFFIKDSNSSNGTYINKHQQGIPLEDGKRYNSKVTQSNRELYSGDLLQLGTQLELPKKSPKGLTYSCIIAELELILPNGSSATRGYYGLKDHNEGVVIADNNSMDEAVSLAPQVFQLNLLLTEASEREKNIREKVADVTKSALWYKEQLCEIEKTTIEEHLIVAYVEALTREQEIVQMDTSDAGEVRRKMSKLQNSLLECQTVSMNLIETVTSDNLDEIAKTNELARKLVGLEKDNAIMKLLSDKTAQKNKCLMHENVLLKKELLREKDGNERIRNICDSLNAKEIPGKEDEAHEDIVNKCLVSSIQQGIPEEIVKASDVVIDKMLDKVDSHPEFALEENMVASTSCSDVRSSSSQRVSLDDFSINYGSTQHNGNELGGYGDYNNGSSVPAVEDYRPETFDHPQWIDYSLIGPSCHVIMENCKISDGTCPVESIEDGMHRLTMINAVMSSIIELFEWGVPESDSLDLENIRVVEDDFNDARNFELGRMPNSPRQFDVVNPVDYRGASSSKPLIVNEMRKDTSWNDDAEMWRIHSNYYDIPSYRMPSAREIPFTSEEAKAELEQILDGSEPQSQPSERCRQEARERDAELIKMFSNQRSPRRALRWERNILLQSFVLILLIVIGLIISTFMEWSTDENKNSH